MGENWIISKSYRNRVTSLKQETKENQEMHVWHIYWNTALKISNQNMTLHVTEVSAYKTLEECQILELLVYLHTQKDSRTKICDLCGFLDRFGLIFAGQVWHVTWVNGHFKPCIPLRCTEYTHRCGPPGSGSWIGYWERPGLSPSHLFLKDFTEMETNIRWFNRE